jgi:hypothetical protein
MRQRFFTKTDEAGRFSFDQLPAETMYFFAFKEDAGYPDAWFNFFSMPGDTGHKETVVAGKTLENVVFRLPPRYGRADITIVDSVGNIIPLRAQLVFDRPDKGGVIQVQTGWAPMADGRLSSGHTNVPHPTGVPSGVPAADGGWGLYNLERGPLCSPDDEYRLQP